MGDKGSEVGSKGREGAREDKGTGVVNANSGGQEKRSGKPGKRKRRQGRQGNRCSKCKQRGRREAEWEAREEKEETGKTRGQV